MGGRGASSGISERTNRFPNGNPYGSQFHKILESGNIKFVAKNGGNNDTEPLLETMTRGRVYVTVGGGRDLQQIIYFDNDNKRIKTIDLDHQHKGLDEHVHHGYYHDENEKSKLKATKPTPEEKNMIARVRNLWQNYINQQ